MSLSTTLVRQLTGAALRSNEDFARVLKKIIADDLGLSVAEFSAEAGIPVSTLYKILNGEREPNLKTLREIVAGILTCLDETDADGFIAVIASRPFLNTIKKSTKTVDGRTVNIHEYPANTIEEAIISAIQAESDGASAIVCAPIVSPTIEKILTIPIVTMLPREGLEEEIQLAAEKI